MCDGQRKQQAPKSAHYDGAMSRSKSGSLLPLPTKIRSSPSMIVAATTRRILAAPSGDNEGCFAPDPRRFCVRELRREVDTRVVQKKLFFSYTLA
ncbi:unnamed protein product [Trichogramma brassicae]|nr:unnamed protein product [Trichogramma brassicae]